MDCPKCNGETESELQYNNFKADEVVDVSRCSDCGFEFYQTYRKHRKWREWHERTGASERYTKDMESPTEEMSQTEYRLPHYSSTSVVYPSWYRESY
jgi:hypothetical protein